MTKLQMKKAALELCKDHKASKVLTTALEELLEQYASNGKSDTVKREKVITVDGNEMVWCNRHEIYEPLNNFKNAKADCCLLAHKHWVELGKKVKELNDTLVLKATEGEDVQEIAVQLKEAKELRAGRYNFEDNALQFADIENYTYDTKYFVSGEDA